MYICWNASNVQNETLVASLHSHSNYQHVTCSNHIKSNQDTYTYEYTDSLALYPAAYTPVSFKSDACMINYDNRQAGQTWDSQVRFETSQLLLLLHVGTF